MAALVKTQKESLTYWGSIEQRPSLWNNGEEKSPSTLFAPRGGATPLRSHHQHSHPLSILCWGNIRITRECNEDYQIDITDGLFFPRVFYMVYPFISLSSLNLSLTHSLSCSPWLICVFTLCPSSSLTASGYMWREKHLMNRRTWKERDRGL